MPIRDVGDRITATGSFTVAGAPTDPTAVTAEILDPDGNVTIYADGDLDNPTTGTWTIDVDLTKAGAWRIRFRGEGAATAAEEETVYVARSRFPDA